MVPLGLELGGLTGQPEWGDIFSQQTQRPAGGRGAGRPTQGPCPPGLEPGASPTVWGLMCPSLVPLGDEQCPLNQPLLPRFCPPPSLRVLWPHDRPGPRCPRVPASHPLSAPQLRLPASRSESKKAPSRPCRNRRIGPEGAALTIRLWSSCGGQSAWEPLFPGRLNPQNVGEPREEGLYPVGSRTYFAGL